ncbi:MAG TPA: lipid A export permease/ATP-binding protein MsbA [Accumulibacter sp.]|uniref:lipid A export permease/ATP-binding protein MsbA n=3 Tax=Accumulibacter sp. TaxID=2053492 RepID=UPI0028781C1D|nr:lipid A export permease/ATP-binding protein MsbA [Accumulibacter sp.]MDS4056248.1 lipid A export permease/ATP-binding protein MsbA [Accumulibacter sp.]HMW63893.1 lipid A export permease/ATP-binding protein MsbA [Accumulibacter sp.]HNB69101.1 lipid A export permease/ATP-binding protein MsbA [Accumulibacter sp.]HNC26788.1 lipid A export permease/ATP-binding protein MsbA [Accumulibacter sp.]HND39077.1 lipid A export permease/ATP-binding protein MsbA [Accumulibacter sp.]
MPSVSQLPVSSLRVYLRLLGYLRPLIGWFAVSLLGYLIFASSQPMMAGILKYFVDGLNAGPGVTRQVLPVFGELDLIHAVPLLLVLAITWQGLGSFLGNYYLARVSLGLIDDLRRALFASLLRLPNAYFDQNNSGHLISRITYDVTMVTGAATEAIKVVIREGLTVIFLFAYLLWMNWQLTLVMLAILPIIGLMVTRASRKFRRQSRKIQVAMGDLTHVAAEAIQGYRVVRSFGGEDYETARFHRASAENTAKQLRMVRTAASYTPALQFVTFSAMAGLLVLVLLLRGDASVGGLVAYITAAGMLPKPIRQLSEVSATIQKGLAGAESIFAQIDEVPEPDHGRVERARVSGRLEVRGLSFTYPGSERRVLSEVSFSAQPGQMIALVGRSGSGKSTLVSLIPRFYQHDSGQIMIDGVAVEDYTLRNLRRHIALVTQQVVLFNDTVASNIAYGDLASAPRAAIEQAAAMANAAQFIDRLPQRYDTPVGENGVLLSGGQRQRLAIARAILKDAPILILDEATSALDSESERHIQSALDQVMAGRTTLVIAHRLSTIEKADLILVMDEGRIVERGTHAELLAVDGHYARLHARQFSEASPIAPTALAGEQA